MRLTPVEILELLGFTVPAEGVEISSDDAYLHTSALRLLGKTLSVSNVPVQSLREIDAGLAAFSGHPRPELAHPQSRDIARLRTTFRILLMQTYAFTAE